MLGFRLVSLTFKRPARIHDGVRRDGGVCLLLRGFGLDGGRVNPWLNLR
jgi:hypothetical protein